MFALDGCRSKRQLRHRCPCLQLLEGSSQNSASGYISAMAAANAGSNFTPLKRLLTSLHTFSIWQVYCPCEHVQQTTLWRYIQSFGPQAASQHVNTQPEFLSLHHRLKSLPAEFHHEAVKNGDLNRCCVPGELGVSITLPRWQECVMTTARHPFASHLRFKGRSVYREQDHDRLTSQRHEKILSLYLQRRHIRQVSLSCSSTASTPILYSAVICHASPKHLAMQRYSISLVFQPAAMDQCFVTNNILTFPDQYPSPSFHFLPAENALKLGFVPRSIACILPSSIIVSNLDIS